MAVARRRLTDEEPSRLSGFPGLEGILPIGDTRESPRELFPRGPSPGQPSAPTPAPAPAPAAPPTAGGPLPAAPQGPQIPQGVTVESASALPSQASSALAPSPVAMQGGGPRRVPAPSEFSSPSQLFSGPSARASGSRLFGGAEGLTGGGLGVPGRAGGSEGQPTEMMLALLRALRG